MNERRAVIRVQALRYRRAGKKEKGQILDEVVKLTGYHRWYAVRLLGLQGEAVGVGQRRRLVGELKVRSRRRRGRTYTEAVVGPLRTIWAILDGICGKRLVGILPEAMAVLERHGEIELDAPTREKLCSISAATIDRLLAPERKKLALARARSGTKPGTLLKHQIPIRTFAEWDQSHPGFVEIDLVGHEGGIGGGDFCQTLDVTDVASGWTDIQAVANKAEIWVFQALKVIRQRLPFPLLGIDSDNGGEFINHQLLSYCQQERISFTRGRACRKNDGCFVEQKNYSIVRRAVGYARYEGTAQLELLNRLYGHLRLYTNYFQPVMKLVKKERTGAKVKKIYDRPQTPYQRLLNSPVLTGAAKQRLQSQYATLNPAALKRQISQLQKRLWDTVRDRGPHSPVYRRSRASRAWAAQGLSPCAQMGRVRLRCGKSRELSNDESRNEGEPKTHSQKTLGATKIFI